ncbi:hypothetical protein [Billgrantia ethanolica]|uniref:Sulfotransferase domain-containing protein n=1 Tax=Billgrantia ethanolica TaxID=2733486 RepID=A0ABS9A083_9GAMM|nr:hypothetical protein [Halomonas ethanolica]MCE8002218.1 hypothetical protein [Halomonas ethanolica]
MKRIFLHIGAHKSASTTIQRTLRANNELVETRYGFSFIGGQELKGTAVATHFRSIANKEILNQHDFAKSIKDAKEDLKRVLNNCGKNDVIISWEGILGHSSLDIYKGIYTHHLVVAESIKEIFGDELVNAIMVVRKQDAFIESCYLQQIKEQRSLSFDEFVEAIDIKNLSWHDVASSCHNKLPGKFTALPFELILELGTEVFIEKFLYILTKKRCSLNGFNVIKQANASFSEYGVRLSREILPKVSGVRKKEINRILFKEFSSDKYGKASFFNSFNRESLRLCLKEDSTLMFDHFLAPSLIKSGCSPELIKKYYC